MKLQTHYLCVLKNSEEVKMRLPKGTLTKLAEATDLNNNYLCDLVSTRSRPGRTRSIELEEACKKIGLDVPRTTWLFGTTNEIKKALTNTKPNLNK